MKQPTTDTLPGIWMKLIDHKRLAKLMAIQGVSDRGLAKAAGWKSHTFVKRLREGTATGCKPDPALRIARHLGVGVDDLFMVRLSTDSGRSSQRVAA